jgi:DNA-binding HxlR family transcriptional regulator
MADRRHAVNLDDLDRASTVIGRKWTTTILFHLAQEPLRFAELRRRVGGVSEKVLIQRLRELEAEAIVTRTVEATVPPQVEYAMSAHGKSLCELVEAMASWGSKHRAYLARYR